MELPAQLTIDDTPVTVTAIYPDDGPMGSVTFDDHTTGENACGAVFLESQNGIAVEDVTEEAVTAAIAAVI